jgi:methyl-accepting chemotaxis protein
MLKMIRKRLSLTITAKLILVAVPLAAACVWRVVVDEQDAVEDTVLRKGRVAALVGAQAYAQILENGVASGELELKDLIDPRYEEIAYPPQLHVEGARYHTKFDKYTDTHGVQALEDAFLVDPDIEFASGIDATGYVPTTITRYAIEPNGDPRHDKNARKKRRYDSLLHLAAARYAGAEPLIQPYVQEGTGKSMWCVVAPITVSGKHFGAFRVGVLRDQIAVRSWALATRLAWLLGAVLGAILIAAVLLIHGSMRPLVRLVGQATRLSLDSVGDELDRRVHEPGTNEVSQMAKALDRLRQSVRASVRLATKGSL